jgi:hypothetical protein
VPATVRAGSPPAAGFGWFDLLHLPILLGRRQRPQS